MIRRITNILLIVMLLLLNYIFIGDSLEISRIYPFHRLQVGNVLIYNVNILKADSLYKHRIETINGDRVSGDNLVPLLMKHRYARELSVLLSHNGSFVEKKYLRPSENHHLLWSLLLIILIANIHYLYGFLIRFIRPNSYQSGLYFFVSIGLSLFFFFLVDIVSFHHLRLSFLLVVMALGYIILLVGYNLSSQRLSLRAAVIYLIASVSLLVFIRAYFFSPFDIYAIKFLDIYLLLVGFLSLGKLFINVLSERNIYVFKRAGIIAIGILLAFISPIAIGLAWLYWEVGLPAHVFSSLTLLIPLLIGNSILQHNVFSLRLFLGRGIVLLSANLIIALVTSALIYILTSFASSGYELLLDYALFVVTFMALMKLKRITKRQISNVLFFNRDQYSRSLQNIAELVSSPQDVHLKIDMIFSEIRHMMGLPTIKMALFQPFTAAESAQSDSLEFFAEDSDLTSYFSKNRSIIYRYSLIKNSLLEQRILQFLEARDVILIIPVFVEQELLGALLVGEKADRELFSGIDIHYLETVSLQLCQLFVNDRLFRNYIQKRHFERELDIASFIQMRLFPKKAPEKSRLRISFYNRPFLKVTGDYFDFITLDKNCTAIIIGDVSGHGLSAAMILSMTNSLIHAMLREKRSIEKAIEEINHFLNHRYKGTELITLFAGIFNKETREFTYINAGHCTPILMRRSKKQITSLEGRSKIIGADPGANYFASKITFERDDEMILYTDGTVEIFDDQENREFTEKNLLKILSDNINSDIDGKINAVVDGFNKFNPEAIKDDITLIALQIL